VSQTSRSSDSAIVVSWMTPAGEHRTRLTTAFCIGRGASGELQIDDRQMSQACAAVFLRDGQWWLRDLGSADGVLLDGTRIQDSPLAGRAVLEIGTSGLQVTIDVEEPALAQQGVAGAAPSIAPADDRTVFRGRAAPRPTPSPSNDSDLPIRVQVGADTAAREFTSTVRLGRDANCTLRIDDEGVSRLHAEIYRMGSQWFARDLGSRNGTYLDGAPITEAPLPGRCTLRLGADGPRIELSYAAPTLLQSSGTATPRSLEEVAAHYFDENSKAPAGDRTMMVRRAFSTVKRQQKRRYGSVIAGAVALLLVAVGIGIYQHFQLQRTRGIAEQLFYNMKAVELQLARLEEQVVASGDATHGGELLQGREKLAEMATQYDSLLEELGVLNENTAPEERLIFRMARAFGECEIAMPKDFVDEVQRHIEIWRSDERLVNGLRRAQEQHLAPVILETLARHQMPPQFFYVALQESDFRQQAVGPETRFGIAKGLWQLMPETAVHYGLQMGPLLDVPQFDPADQRFDATAATDAAARYLADLYRGEAQASGLLVLASYNWGTTRVRNRIRAMKENPRDRNFWRLLAQTDMPKETRDYVMRIFAAAVIGEDPKMFGFEFDRPLGDVSQNRFNSVHMDREVGPGSARVAPSGRVVAVVRGERLRQ
jgi:membrane-bound lytic murein transglycosylase D